MEAAEQIKAKLAAKLGDVHGAQRQLMIVLQAWRQNVAAEIAERKRAVEVEAVWAERAALEEKLERDKERRAAAHAARHLLGHAARCFVAWPSR